MKSQVLQRFVLFSRNFQEKRFENKHFIIEECFESYVIGKNEEGIRIACEITTRTVTK